MTFKNLFNALTLPSLLLNNNKDFTIEDINEEYLRLTGIVKSDVLGKPLIHFYLHQFRHIDPLRISELKLSLRHVVESKVRHKILWQGINLTIPGVLVDGDKNWKMENSPLIDNEGDIHLILHCIDDITGKFTIEQELQSLNDDLHFAKSKIQEKEKSLSRVQKLFSVGYWEYNVENKKFIWSDEVYKIWSVSKDNQDLKYDFLLNTIPIEDRNEFDSKFTRLNAAESNFNFEHRIILPDGSIKWVQQKGILINDNTLKGNFIEGSVLDITSQKLLQLSLKESNQRFQHIINFTFDGLWDWDIASNTFFAGEGYFQLFGKIENDLTTSEKVQNRIHPEDIKNVFDSAVTALKGKEIYWIYEYRYLRSDGSYAIVSNKAVILRDKNGKALRFIGAMQDITRRRQEELRLRLLETVTIHTNDAVMITKASSLTQVETEIFYVNNAFLKMTGYRPEEVIGKSPKILQGAKTDPIVLIKISQSLKFRKSGEFTLINYKKDGSEFWNNFTINPVKDENGHFAHWIAIQRDVTAFKILELHQKELNEHLEKQTKELTMSNAQLEQYAYVASHDLLEPIRMVKSFLKLLGDKYRTILDEKAMKYIHYAVDGANRMEILIKDLLKLSIAGAKNDKEKTDLNKIISSIQLLYKLTIEENDIIIQTSKLPIILVSRIGIEQVFQNLISNAIKYRKDNEKLIIVIDAFENETHWNFSIRDNGIGMKKDDLGLIFTIFKRLHSKSKYSGTGIGLALCKKIVERSGGEIYVESEVEKGSTFYFSIIKEIK